MYFSLHGGISQYSRAINKTRGWDIPIKPISWNKVPCGQFIKEISVWYLNVNKRYGRLKNRSRHKKSTQGKNFLIILNSRVQPQRKVVLRWFFFYKYIISQCIWEKKRKNLAPVVESQFSETFTWGLMGNRKISNIFGDYCNNVDYLTCLLCI